MNDSKRVLADLPGATDWTEKEINEREVDELVRDVERIQERVSNRALQPSHQEGTPELQRGFHAKGFGLPASFRIREDVPPNLRKGIFADGGRAFDAIVRFSNALSVSQTDLKPDQRGLAIRVLIDGDPASQHIQDFLMTNTPVSFGKDAAQFLEVSRILLLAPLLSPLKILSRFRREGFRILSQLTNVILRSYATERYWSRTSFRIGDFAMKYRVTPRGDVDASGLVLRLPRALREAGRSGPRDYLREELIARLERLHRQGKELQFDFQVQLYQNEEKTPMENASVEWKEEDAPFASVAEIAIACPTWDGAERRAFQERVEKMAFSPWNTRDFTPLGTMNRARKRVYDASAKKRGGCPLGFGREPLAAASLMSGTETSSESGR